MEKGAPRKIQVQAPIMSHFSIPNESSLIIVLAKTYGFHTEYVTRHARVETPIAPSGPFNASDIRTEGILMVRDLDECFGPRGPRGNAH